MRRLLTLLFLLGASGTPARAAEFEGQNVIAVLPFQSGTRPVAASELKLVEDAVFDTLSGFFYPEGAYRLVQGRTALSREDFDLTHGCDPECEAREAKALSAQRYLTGAVGRTGDGYVAFVTVFNPSGRRGALQLRGATVNALALAFESKARLFVERGLGIREVAAEPPPDDVGGREPEQVAADAALAKIDPDLQQRECDDGDADACMTLGWRYLEGVGVTVAEERGKQLYDRGCKLGNSTACFNLGVRYGSDGAPAQQAGRAAELFTTGCDRGHGDCCALLGVLHLQRNGVPRNPSRALTLLQKACDHNSALGCTALGRMHLRGEATRRNPAAAARCFDRACSAGDAPACTELGDLYRSGQGVKRNAKRAWQLYSMACDGDEADGCEHLARSYANGEGVEKDEAYAQTLFTKACTEGNASACAEVK